MRLLAKFFMWCDKNQLEWVAISAGVFGAGVVTFLMMYVFLVLMHLGCN